MRDSIGQRSFRPFGADGRAYDLREVDLLTAVDVPDAQSADEDELCALVRGATRDAVIYGLPAALQYANLHRTILADGAPSRFNTWTHGRQLAGPEYPEFRTPNVDTLYSNAWLDLTHGPLEIDIPPMGERYFTVNLFDAHSNAVNLSTRTLGGGGGRVRLVLAGEPDPPVGQGDAVRELRVATPYLWVLMRIFVRLRDDLPTVHALQDRVALTPTPPGGPVGTGGWPAVPDDVPDAESVLRALDQVLRRNGHPIQEEGLLARFRRIGVGGPEPFDPSDWSPVQRRAAAQGYDDALGAVRAVIAHRGRPAGDSGWRTLSSGAYGYNYLHRAATNYVGLGGTTREESGPYTALVDAAGARLDGRLGSYRMRFTPPPVDGFWSLTVYDLESRNLVPNRLHRYAINSLTEGLAWRADGTLDIRVSTEPGHSAEAWLPAPDAPFYLVLRAYLGHPEVVDGSWAPCPVEREETQ